MKLREAPIKETGRTPVEDRRQHQRRVTRRKSRTSITGREDEDAGGKASKPPREGTSPETWTGRRTRNRLKGAEKQTGEKERLHHISISVKDVSEGTEKRGKPFDLCFLLNSRILQLLVIHDSYAFLTYFCDFCLFVVLIILFVFTSTI